MTARGLLLLLLLVGNAILAGDSAQVRGVVRDGEGNPLAGATIVVLPPQGREFHTADDGTFLVPDLPAGRYTIIVLGPLLVGSAYAPRVRHDVQLNPSETASLQIQLEHVQQPLVVYYDSPTEADLARFSDVLTAMEEPEMCRAITADWESYRFLWLRSFDNPVLIHLAFRNTEVPFLRYKELTRSEHSDIGRLTENRDVDLNELLLEELGDEELVEAVLDGFRRRAQEHFWSLSYRVDDGTIGVDGASWIIEGTKDGRCHVVTRWSPEETDGFRRLAEDMMRMSGKRFYHDEVY